MDHQVAKAKALENANAARVCLEHKLPNACVSRSYYACAQLAAACLIRWDALPAKPNHVSVLTAFDTQWRMRHGHSKYSALLQELYAARQDADYNPDFRFKIKDATIITSKALDLINFICQKEGL